ncbi:PEP-CTERM sorting domain-containing protein [Paludisphaera borealis]|uniref:Ice-binding protein C-terminal domain-containing protein n=1 Tax=Paludisphaera borealis TaxID=1387353 RepID=A0A1U7CM42_9BACT|nr:PEP-CTERM sorting domain-containing protein [Paludisphaera borealis]APW59991.1 hypothetical protein BSF38_01453 [Paludisphaera borealis]
MVPRFSFAGLLTLLLGLSPTARAAHYTFTTIDVPGARDTEVVGINNHGQLTGAYFDLAGFSHAFVYSNGVFTTIAPPPGNQFFGARAINDAGEVLGHADVTGNYLFNGVTYTPIPNVPGSSSTLASGINNAGDITGDYVTADGSQVLGFLLKNGVFTTFSAPGGGNWTSGVGINDADQIVGHAYDSPLIASEFHGFLYRQGVFTRIEPPGVFESNATGINNLGQIVGTYHDPLIPTPSHIGSFLYSNGVYTKFDPPGAVSSGASDINDAGQIVGTFVDAAGREHGFIASVVPEPSSLAMAGIAGLVGLGCTWHHRRRRRSGALQ